jgi:cytidine deaminase
MNHFKLLFSKAQGIAKDRKLNKFGSCGGVGSALLTKKGNIYTGICIDVPCGIGFCAEHAAIAEMLKNGESEIKEIIAVTSKKEILPPCGRCRELISQIDKKNKYTIVHLSTSKRKTIKVLLPEPYEA